MDRDCLDDHDSDYEEYKPVFVSKKNRSTISAISNDDATKPGTNTEKIRSYVLNSVRENATDIVQLETLSCPEESSDDEELEFQGWKVRELNRVARDHEERRQLTEERAEMQLRRRMSDSEVIAREGVNHTQEQRDKAQWKFMQKYYHKGVFYMDSSSVKDSNDVRKKDYSQPTLEDKVDKEKLPQILQVKNFGKRGRTKYTHLLDQDTTVQGTKRVAYRIDPRVSNYINSKKSR